MPVNEKTKLSLGQLLSPSRVLMVKGTPSKKELIETLVQAVCRDFTQLDPTDVASQVLKREEGVATTLDTGLAIPHARLEELPEFTAALALLPTPLKEEKPVRAVFLFLSPAKPEFFPRHLQLLAALAETFKPEFIDELISLQDPAHVFRRFLP